MCCRPEIAVIVKLYGVNSSYSFPLYLGFYLRDLTLLRGATDKNVRECNLLQNEVWSPMHLV
ncbi:hypothetical protein DK853_08285 [Klebsiella oxytoca]|nr:hypothetical protein DK853_08285 [Klebsiella oxytoca]TXU70483.1 hypothetical protein D4N05_21915 [Klebsiella oxytoca]TXU95111.1 hypothetical protein D4M90_15700 [Klebsiella oxytoca]